MRRAYELSFRVAYDRTVEVVAANLDEAVEKAYETGFDDLPVEADITFDEMLDVSEEEV